MKSPKKFWSDFLYYLKRREMRLFWLLFSLSIIIAFVEFIYLPFYFSFVFMIILLIIISLVGISTYRLARTTLSVEIEKKQFENIVINLYDGVIVYDANFKVLVFNRAASKIFNLPANQVIGQAFTPQLAGQSHMTRLAQVMFPSLAPSVIVRSEPGEFPQVVDLSFNDPLQEIRVTTTRLNGNSGELLGFMKLIHDRSREVAVSKSKSEFITVAAHQLRTPLSAISWTFDVLAGDQKLPANLLEVVKNGKIATGKVLKTVNDLLDVSKIEEGGFGYKMTNLEIVSFLENILAQKIAISKQYGLKIYFNRPLEPSLVIKADSKKLTVALDNILDNALRYNTESGEVILSAKRQDNQPFLEISISDTGIGIPPEEIDKVFSKFYRGSNVLKFKTEGTGLGLYIAKNIIRQHGGQIWVESTLNRGTTFHLTLPTDPNLVPIQEVFVEE